jgi:uncharacterized protein (TIGR02266 family)
MGKDAAGNVIERRQSPRIQYKTNVTLNSEHNFYTGLSVDISEGGIFIATHQPLPRGTEVEIEFSIPTFPEAVRATGLVQWVRPFSYGTMDANPGMGVKFLRISPPQAVNAIQTFIKKHREPELYEE